MKITKLALLFCATTSFAMQQQSTDFSLDEKGLQEFKEAKKTLAEKGKDVTNADSNRLLAHFKSLAEKDNNQLKELFNKYQPAIKELHASVTNNPDYKKSYDEAVAGTDDAKWDSWRKTNGKLMMPLLTSKGIKITFPSAQFITANPEASDEALTYYTASSFLLYYARQIQREKTGKDLPPIKID